MLDKVNNRASNGLDLTAREAAIEAIQGDARRAIVGFDVVTRWLGQARSETTVDGYTVGGKRIARSHKIVIDEPAELLGSDCAPNPQEMLMAAFNACITFGYVTGASVMGITLESLEIRTSSELDLRGFLGLSDAIPPGYEHVEYEVLIKGDGTPEQFEEIHRSVMKTSPNYFNLGRPVRLTGALRVC